ncbi:glycerate kinase [Anaerobacillus isosaccharinicus]|uniref:Glycerate kinase n=1 Tax=Anaerobacillus isosaccharinicus TaxID=1532552 RepID=A0A1S2LIV1_9BACI|nr:glycerate kinase [Anaerobacillus isosaccharinicus]MBA5588314.1 glycerate kinase [Anaerobacillus isosaccharinicus]QOY38250.1 glycerate kinase [Anaerobacillus isosaccharinicus]
MKIIIASDSYKGSCSTLEVAIAIEKGIRKIDQKSEIIKIPVADGGEGTVEALVLGTGGRYEEVEVLCPLGRKIKAKYGILKGNTAVIEMAEASGLTRVNADELNPRITTTYGTGQIIKAAMDKGCKKILIGIGGSATNDGGSGMAQALGASLIDRDGKEIGYGGSELSRLYDIDIKNIDQRIYQTEIIVMSDVANPLCGPSGASYIYGPQKGATKVMVKELDENLKHYSNVIKQKLGIDVEKIQGAGAAGGLGAGLIAFCNASLHSGIEKVLDVTDIDQHLIDADIVITGEGKIDNQSVYGKVPVGVAQRAAKYNVPVVAIVGSIGEGASAVYDYGVDAIIAIVPKPMSLNMAMENGAKLIEQTAENVIRLLNLRKPFRNQRKV